MLYRLSNHSRRLQTVCTRIKQSFKKHDVLLQVGLDNAGKTSILYQLHLGQAVVTQPTVGCNVEQIQHKNLTFEVSTPYTTGLSVADCQQGYKQMSSSVL